VRLRLPALNDAKLLLAALVWPPSCFVSDATAKTGGLAHPVCNNSLALMLRSFVIGPWPGATKLESAHSHCCVLAVTCILPRKHPMEPVHLL
jgi:hypothetical protein